MKNRTFSILVAVTMALALVFSAVLVALPQNSSESSAGVSMEYETKLFQKNTMNQINITVDSSAWDTMLTNATAEEYIMCDISINGTKFSSVGIRPKGNSSLSTVASDPDTDRFSFKLEFDHYVKNQTCWGLDKFVLNNMQSDNTYMKEYLSYDILSFIGVTSPLYSYAHITVNGEEWGLYLAVEGVEESFAERNYGNSYGQLYKPENMGMRGNGQMNDMIGKMDQNNDQDGQPPQWNNQNDVASGSDTWQMPQIPGQDGTASGSEDQQRGFGNMQPPDTQGGTTSGSTSPQDGSFPQEGAFAQGNMGGNFLQGGMTGNSQGVDLVYSDDNSDSYSNIFDNAVFSSAKESDFQRVIKALKGLSAGENLEESVDVDQVLRYIAANTVLVNLDSYFGSMQHNYYLYEKDGVLSMVPWDYNLAFGGFQSGSAQSSVNLAIDTPVSGTTLDDRPMIGKLLENDEYLAKYHAYLQEIVSNYFNNGTFTDTVDSLNSLIGDYVKNDVTAFCTYEEYTASLPVLKEFGSLRAQSIQGQLDGTIPATSDGQSADSSALVQADFDLSVLGTQGGTMNGGDKTNGGFGGKFSAGQPNNANGSDDTASGGESSDASAGAENTALARSGIILSAENQDGTASGSDGQIPPQMPGNQDGTASGSDGQTLPQMPGNQDGTASGSDGQTPPQMPGNQDGTASGSDGQTPPQMPGNQDGTASGGDGQTPPQMPEATQNQTQSASINLSGLWVILACVAAVVAGIIFALCFRRRKQKNIL